MEEFNLLIIRAYGPCQVYGRSLYSLVMFSLEIFPHIEYAHCDQIVQTPEVQVFRLNSFHYRFHLYDYHKLLDYGIRILRGTLSL